jgi:hypothetical protein
MNDLTAETPTATETDGPRGMSRRAMIAATAWTVPAIVIATSAPAMAASPGVFVISSGCKHPGGSQNPFNKEYHFVLTIKNTTGANVTVTLLSALKSGIPANFSVGAGIVPVNQLPKNVIVPPSAGAAGAPFIIHLASDNSANIDLTLIYTYAGVPGSASAVITGVSPCTYSAVGGVYP